MAKKATKNTKDRKLISRYKKFLPVPLTDAELLTRADQLARCEKTLDLLRTRRRATR